MNARSVILFCWIAVVGAMGIARGQWITQTLALKAGWNAAFLHVDASHATINELVAPDGSFAIEEVWMWRPELSSQQFVDSPQVPVGTDSRWVSWTRVKGGDSALTRLVANAGYLIKVKSTIANYSWAIRGRPVAPRYQWTTSGLNFLGFPTVPVSPPVFDTFMSTAPADFTRAAEFYRYPGGPLGAGNPSQIYALRTTPVRRGEAYWIKSGDYYNRYFAPIEVSVSETGVLNYGDTGRSIGVRVRNLTASPLVLTMRMLVSEDAPTGQPEIAGVPPLLLRGTRTNLTSLAYPYRALTTSGALTWNLAAAGAQGSDAEIILGLDRSALSGPAGSVLAGVLRFTDSLGHSQIDVGVTAKVGVYSGLWVGSADVTDVGQFLKRYQRDPNNNPVLGPDGRYVVTGTDSSITGVPVSYPLRLIVHNPASGSASLLQRIFTGHDSQTNPILSRSEGALNRNLLKEARRISASHLPFDEANGGWTFTGALLPGSTITASVTNRFNDGRSNPFIHTYHPDHDGLNATFTQSVPQGSEAYTVVREITLKLTPPADDFNSRTAAGQTLAGEYSEVVKVQGLARGGGAVDTRSIQARGQFTLNRISAVTTLTSNP